MLVAPRLRTPSGDGNRLRASSTPVTHCSDRPLYSRETESYSIFGVGTQAFVVELSKRFDNGDRLNIGNAPMDLQLQNPGLVVICDLVRKQIHAQADLVGLFPGYWTVQNGGFVISDSIGELSGVYELQTDDVGLIEFMRFAYTIGQRTPLRDVFRLRPGESLTFDSTSGSVSLSDNSPLWANSDSQMTLESTVDRGVELLIENCRPMRHSMLMMSAGWDSRTLLAGAIASGVSKDLLLYHHGDSGSRESGIVRRLAAMTGMQLVMNEIDASFFDADFLCHSFQRYDNVVHPHWHMAAQRVADFDRPVRSVCAGIFGEIMGGHYGPPMVQSGSEKAVTTLRYLMGLGGGQGTGSGEDPGSAMGFLYQDEYKNVPWYLDRDTWSDRFRNVHEAVNEDTKLAVERLVKRGVDTREAVVEAFVTEHRGSQHVAAQLHGAAQYLPIVAPFCTRSMATFACDIPYALKFHNTLNQAIIRRLNPELLAFPTAAILLKAKRSVLMQEFSRVARRAIEIGGWKLHDLTNKRTRQPRFGWPNYAFLGENKDVFDKLIASLRSPIWSKQNIRDNCYLRPHGSYHSLMEMMMKIKTLDFLGVK